MSQPHAPPDQGTKRVRQDSTGESTAQGQSLVDQMAQLVKRNTRLEEENQELKVRLLEMCKQVADIHKLLLSGKVVPAPQQVLVQPAAVLQPVAQPPPQTTQAQADGPWQTVSRKARQTYAKAAKAAPVKPATKPTDNRPPVITKNDRRILIPRNPKGAPRSNLLEIRNTVNGTLNRCNAPRNVVVTSATYNQAGTLVLVTRDDCTCADVLKFKKEIHKDLKNVD